jgi:hypothetical protein
MTLPTIEEYLARVGNLMLSFKERQSTLRRIGYRLAVCNMKKRGSDEAWHEAIQTAKHVLQPAYNILAAVGVEPPELRTTAVQILGESFRPEAIKFLLTATRDPDPFIVKEACFALFRISCLRRGLQVHARIRSVFKRSGSEPDDLLRGCLAEYSLLRWIGWRFFVRSWSTSVELSERADALARVGSYQIAIPEYREAIRYWPYDPIPWLSLGESLIAAGQRE